MHPLSILDFGPEILVPFMVFAVPIVAIVGGITAGIVKTIGHQRLIEMAQRERIAAIERGVDLAKLPPLPVGLGADEVTGMYLSPYEHSRRRSQNLMIGGIVTLAVGIGLAIFLSQIQQDENVWVVGIIPATLGLGLLICAWIVRPRGSERNGGSPPPQTG